MDDEEFEGLRDALGRKAKVWEDAELSRMEGTLSEQPAAFYGDVTPPGFCHPYHEKSKRFIINWLDGKGSSNSYQLYLPKPPSVRALFVREDLAPTMPSLADETITMRQQKVFATAPYVGRPFGYWWRVGIDTHGRCVGGTKTTLAYVAEEFAWWSRIPYATGSHPAEMRDERRNYVTCLRCGQGSGHDIHRGEATWRAL